MKLKKWTKKAKAGGPPARYAIVAVGQNSNGNDIYKFITEKKYEKLKAKMNGAKSPKNQSQQAVATL